ncbi:MAG: methylmalonyl Co-A mutase-associated GTPase MeaB [Bacteroidota bacterium]
MIHPMENKTKSALIVMDGIEQPQPINPDLVRKLKTRKIKHLSVADYTVGIISGNRTLLSQAITLVESSLTKDQEKAQEIIAACLKERWKTGARSQEPEADRQSSQNICYPASGIQHPASSIRIGITGVPGVGKSTFIEALGKYLTAKGHKLAVLAIDPSSSRSKGSILGDKTRMEELAVDSNAFIRPSPSAGSLGGVARKTRETIVLCEAAGFDVIFVETVGVGQSEITVHGMVDFFLLLMLAGAGDELQGIKRGIMEMADAIVINKADGDNLDKARMARIEYANALHLFPPPESGWIPTVDLCSARTKTGITEVWKIILEHREITTRSGYFVHRRREQNLKVFHETIEEGLKHHFFARREITYKMEKMEQEIRAGCLNPYTAARELLEKYFDRI